MTQEDKQLLLKDLCARLPYGVICWYNSVTPCDSMIIYRANAQDKLRGIVPLPYGNIGFMVGISKINALEGDIKPYLRPMSSMTDEEFNELSDIATITLYPDGKQITNGKEIDWLNQHHFDYHGLIEKGLALEAPEGMY